MRLRRDDRGSVLVEATLILPFIFAFVLGIVDFLNALYQWNAAVKAVQVGARIAAVSDPVAVGLNGLSAAVLSASVGVGDPMPDYTVTCGPPVGSAACSCTGACDGVSGYDANAMNTIVYGRGSATCGDVSTFYNAGMCDLFYRITPANVHIEYRNSGLGYAGRPCAPAPTLTVSLRNLNFQFFFVGYLGFGDIPIEPTVTITGEDLSSSTGSC